MQPTKGKFGIVLVTAPLIAFVSKWEGTKYSVYLDVGGVPTVCQGYTGPEVHLGDTWTKDQCDAALATALRKHGEGALACTTYPISQTQYEGIASFTYNVGVGAYCKSELAKKLNAGDVAGACDEMRRWTKVNKVVWRGLVNRREAERQLCEG